MTNLDKITDETAEDGDGIATPIPLPAREPRVNQRFTLSGYPGIWRLVADLSSTAVEIDITRPRPAASVLGCLGDRVIEFERV
jgi:hypothetical protein